MTRWAHGQARADVRDTTDLSFQVKAPRLIGDLGNKSRLVSFYDNIVWLWIHGRLPVIDGHDRHHTRNVESSRRTRVGQRDDGRLVMRILPNQFSLGDSVLYVYTTVLDLNSSVNDWSWASPGRPSRQKYFLSLARSHRGLGCSLP